MLRRMAQFLCHESPLLLRQQTIDPNLYCNVQYTTKMQQTNARFRNSAGCSKIPLINNYGLCHFGQSDALVI